MLIFFVVGELNACSSKIQSYATIKNDVTYLSGRGIVFITQLHKTTGVVVWLIGEDGDQRLILNEVI